MSLAYPSKMSLLVEQGLEDRNVSSLPSSAEDLAVGQHFSKLIGRTKAGNARLHPELAVLLEVNAWSVWPRQIVKDGLRALAEPGELHHSINQHLEGGGIEIATYDSDVATEVVIDIRRTLATETKIELPLR